MKVNKGRSTLVYSLLPLVIYEIVFVLFVVYYSQQDITWFRIAYSGTCIAFLIAIIRIFAFYRLWQQAYPVNNIHTVSLVCCFASLVAYIFCLFILAEGWTNPFSPPIIVFVLLSIPPVIELIIFLLLEKG